MYCTKCGSENKDHAKFCTKCGKPIVKASEIRDKVNYTEPKIDSTMKIDTKNINSSLNSNVNEPKGSKSNVPKIIGITALVLIIVCGSVFAGYKFVIKDEASKGEGNTNKQSEVTESKSDEKKSLNEEVKSDSNSTSSKNEDNSEFVSPESSTKYLTEAELSGYTKDELALIRNEIFARNGYVFKADKYKDYFEAKPWYKKNPSFAGDESNLNEYEKANVKLIKSLEGK